VDERINVRAVLLPNEPKLMMVHIIYNFSKIVDRFSADGIEATSSL